MYPWRSVVRICVLTAALGTLPRSTGAQAIGGVSAADRMSESRSVVTSVRRTPVIRNSEAWSIGSGVSSGGLGVQYDRAIYRPSAFPYWGISVGAGVAGLGGRGWIELPWSRQDNSPWEQIVGGSFLLSPWRLGAYNAAGALGAEVGLRQFGWEGSRYVEITAGAAWLLRGSWSGRRMVPILRLAYGGGER